MRMQRVTYFAGGLPGTVLSIGSAIAFFYGGLRVIDGTLTLGTMGAFLAYQMRVFAPAQALMGLYASLTTAKVSWSRVLEILDAPIDVIEAPDATADRRCQRRADVRGACRSAPIARSRVLDEVSFTARARTDAWRSSAAAASASRRSPTSRRGCSIRMPASFASMARICATLTLESVRRHIVLVEQEPTLLHATIEENIRYVRPGATDDDVRQRGRGGGHRAIHRGPAATATRRWSASAAWRCRPASGSASRWRARFLPIPRCW